MADVIDISGDLEIKKVRRQYARLKGLTDKWEADVEQDPWPTIESMYNRILKLEGILRDADDTLNPLPVFIPEGSPIELESPWKDMRILEEARDIIRGWEHK